MKFEGFKDWALLGLLSVGIFFLGRIESSVSELNVKIAVVIERLDNHDKRIEKLEENKTRRISDEKR